MAIAKQQQKEPTDVAVSVQKRVDLFEQHTQLDRPPMLKILQLDWNGVTVSKLLGKGTFCSVHQVSLHSRPETEYALKCIDPSVYRRPKAFRKGAIDLALEARLLSRLHHPNIIQIHGAVRGDIGESITNPKRPYFIVLEYLTETLDDVMERWKKEESGGFRKFQSATKYMERMLPRIESTALGIARGMEYLHSKGVLFRDLKPQNIGFDRQGQVRIFDFGVARELEQVKRTGDKLGFTGTPRYMANEVGAREEYSLPADVYSFGIVLWQICTLRLPFQKMSSLDEYQESIVLGGARPPLGPIKAPELANLMSQCWDANAHVRPTFTTVVKKLEAIAQAANASSSGKKSGLGFKSLSPMRSGRRKMVRRPSEKSNSTLITADVSTCSTEFTRPTISPSEVSSNN